MIKVLELFGGIGACSKALERLGIDYEIADYVEIDKYAVKSFNAMHGTNFEPQDICKWDKDIEVDLIMHGSPCQDFSLAGLQAGGDEGSGTRSSLMYETVRIVKKLKPRYVIWENVKNVISKKHIHNFNNYLKQMGDIGYKSYYQVLNAKDYGIPQNRERVFTISIRNDIEKEFIFPPKKELKLKLKDMLEDEVDEKYYLSNAMLNYMYGVNQRPSKFPRRERFEANIRGTVQKQSTQTLDTQCNIGVVVSDKNNIHKIEIPQLVKVRKYEVDIEKLKTTLKQHKKYTNKEISLKLDVPLTTVEHWFRGDNCFSIPEPNIWLRLKDLLQIETDYFDKSIIEFEEKEGVYEKANRFYLDTGIAPTLTSSNSDEKIIQGMIMDVKENENKKQEDNQTISDNTK